MLPTVLGLVIHKLSRYQTGQDEAEIELADTCLDPAEGSGNWGDWSDVTKSHGGYGDHAEIEVFGIIHDWSCPFLARRVVAIGESALNKIAHRAIKAGPQETN